MATVEVMDNGLGMGMGMAYHEVHVRRAGAPIGAHGDPDPTVAFHQPAETARAPAARRLDGGRLAIDAAPLAPHETGKREARVGEVAIEYAPAAGGP